jgi:copper chaperone CopZ
MRIVEWTIPAYHCPNCLRKIKAVLAEIDGVRLLCSDQSQHRLTLEVRTPEALVYARRRLTDAGYSVRVH